MDSPNLFSVTVSRINESTDKEPYHTMDAYRVTARQDGSLSIEGDGGHKIYFQQSDGRASYSLFRKS